MPTVVAFETLTELFLNLTNKYKGKKKTAFGRKPSPNGEYEAITWEKVAEDVNAMAAYLVEHGIEQGDRVAILSENRYEWAVVDLAIQLVGGVNVSLYTSLPPNQCEYILQNSEAELFFVSTGIQLKKAIEIFESCEHVRQVIAFDEPRVESQLEEPYVVLYENVMSEGFKLYPKHEEEIHERTKRIAPEDLATLIYTSGTTGKPKGAMLTHRNIVSNVKAAHQHIHIDENDRALSFLPLCHSFERTAGYYAIIAGGGEIYYAESVDTVAKNLTEVHPTIVMSVPRLFEKIYNLVTKSVEEGSTVKKKIFNWAFDVGRQYADGKRGLTALQKPVADKLVFDKLKERTGGNIRFFVSGGAALPAEIGHFFMAAGLNILEGYGLTETSPIMAANSYDHEKMGTVGQVLPGVTVAIQRLEDNKIIAQLSGEDYPTDLTSEPGEILCKGPNVMKGYWKNDEATREMIDDEEWLHTGDVGRFVDGNLQITDRIKHMIVNAGGKNIYPGPIEDLFKTSKWVDQLVVVGERQPFMAALIVPDFEVLEKYANENGLRYESMEDLLAKDEIQSIFKKEIRYYSDELASHEKIRDFRLVSHEFSVESGELTPTLKVKRRVIEEKYGDLIEDIFADAAV
ncbi:long-chain fatty acid--CoA ligase [Aliifodinibius sp. S!AR15-10]|uniref:AMP-dependent synthetase/ligase n=1 Tax=Aliifodinibius sp. S!AR15-10 TaxID=2950437 RepID=UPI0028559299|nr:long-chain fatty acid--CoA ligase [Aliifodinibius sp. S!AR15-10]MDR8390339.1 long-chain fatty acid--CoA ligase [Aliifodinibius sp. S!AR15-10]